MRIKSLFLIAFLTFAGLSSWLCLFDNQAHAQSFNQALAQDLAQAFARYELIKLAPDASAKSARSGKLRIASSNHDFNLELQPRDLLAPNYKAETTVAENERVALARPKTNTFKGFVAGETNSKVRLSINDQKIQGYIFVGDKQFFVEPASNISKSAAPDDFVIYEAADAINNQPMSCDLTERVEAATQEYDLPDLTAAANVFKTVEIATDSDFEFTNARGGAANANQEALNVLNLIEGRFESELGITFAVTFQHAWSTSDPFNTEIRPPSLPINIGSSALNNALGWLAQTWNQTFPVAQYPRDVTHLFTGKQNLIGQGIAFTGSVCANPNFAYSLNGYIDSQSAKYLLAAHELGHNLGASHADAAQSCDNSIMNTQLRGDTALSFCQTSRDQINGFVAGNSSCLTTTTVARAKFDFDGDGKTDVSVFRPSNGVWYRLNSGSGNSFAATQFGLSEDRPTPADFDGDGKTDIAVWRPSNGVWYILYSTTNSYSATQFGLPGDIPVPADFTGDGKAEIAVYRPVNGVWYILNLQDRAFSAAQFGLYGDVPLPNDYDGDGRADYAVFRPSNSVWYKYGSATGYHEVQFGLNGDRPAPADFNGDGKTDIVVYRPRNGVWYILQSQTNVYREIGFGLNGDVPAVGDFDGDGKADATVYRPGNGVWYRLDTSGGYSERQFGLTGDIPAAGAYVP